MKYYLFALTCLGDRSLDCSAATTNHAFAATWDARNSICLCRLNDNYRSSDIKRLSFQTYYNRSERKDGGNQMH
jgi:hypothetical protein